MSAAECFEVSLNSLSDRLDVTYYLIRREVKRELDTGSPLCQLCTPIKTRTPPREAYNEKGIPCLKLRNITGQVLNTTNCDYVPERLKSQFVEAQEYDIILTATGEGTAGRVDIFLEPDNYIVTGENIILRPKLDRINPFYLLAMLRTEIISRQLTHFVRGATGQTHLYWHDIADIKVPETTDKLQHEFEEIFKRAWEKRNSAAQKINQAKTIVCKAGNLKGFDIRHKKVAFETTFKRIEPILRFDVEYNQPIYEAIESTLAKAGSIKANDTTAHACYCGSQMLLDSTGRLFQKFCVLYTVAHYFEDPYLHCGWMPSRRHRSRMGVPRRKPSSTMQIFSSAVNLQRVRRLIFLMNCLSLRF